MVYHFIKIPELPADLQHQSGFVEIVEYLVSEGQNVGAGTPILRVRNWWAEMEILSGVDGFLVSTIFKGPLCVGGSVNIGEPIALVLMDPADQPGGDRRPVLRVAKRLREKPTGHRS